MVELIRTDALNADFKELVRQLDAYLTITDGDEHDFYQQYNGISDIRYAIVAYANGKAVACGAIKPFSENAVEVKRMYTRPYNRGQGLATLILYELETWANELAYPKCILETGKRQHEAIALYQKNGYNIIPNYGQYIGVENSVCFEKMVLT